ncbi:protein FAR1-RELATED SEQUENCE 5-like [Spinacia oleracea]|uniref:Protein FAR1-RELATED SEQUENCE 5-like n=1 Tax=Spinacia oleracea TaxID=3562 RepID=A0ABM3RS46_SPIOL|nr:protein FAR1-RELATED SEQUENCE 5-like [Spinacia oleracea]
MGGNPPITIMTDQAPSIAAWIRNVFPDARHRLCTWHIGEISKKHIGQYRALDGFCDTFSYLLKMLTHYKCAENPWLKNLYTIREMWCPAYSKNYWSGGVLSSQCCETTNKSVSHRLNKTQGLCDFYHVFLDVISEWRSKQNGHDYRNWKGRPEVAAKNCRILLHARTIYTIEAYVLFEEQFLKGMACSQEEKRGNTTIEKSYYVWRPKKDLIKHEVRFNQETFVVDCTCQYFTEMGFLCSHLLRVYHAHCNPKIPNLYILKRWTKAAMCSHLVEDDGENSNIVATSVWREQTLRNFGRLVDASFPKPPLKYFRRVAVVDKM